MPAANSGARRRRRSDDSPGRAIAKPVSQYTVVGTSFPRIDIPDKVDRHLHLRAERARPGDAPRPARPSARRRRQHGRERHADQSIDPTSIAHIPGAQVVQIANFLGVVAPKEYDAIQAAAQLKVTWQTANGFPRARATSGRGCGRPATRTRRTRPATRRCNGNVHGGARRRGEDGVRDLPLPLQRFVPIGPHCAVADVNDERRHRLRPGAGADRASRRTSPA